MYDIKTCIWRFECHHGDIGMSSYLNMPVVCTGFSPAIDTSVNLQLDISTGDKVSQGVTMSEES